MTQVEELKRTFLLGYNPQGEPIYLDLFRSPHLLLGGQSGTGKSRLIEGLAESLKAYGAEVVLCDESSPAASGIKALREVYEFMEKRLNEKDKTSQRHVIILDEYNNLLLRWKDLFVDRVVRLAQKGGTVGVHMVLSTRVTTHQGVPGIIKANIPCRLCYKVASKSESRPILDQSGAELLNATGEFYFRSLQCPEQTLCVTKSW